VNTNKEIFEGEIGEKSNDEKILMFLC